jgi:hypothetical protein
VSNLVGDLAAAVESRIKSAFDLAAISKEVLAKEPPTASSYLYKSRVRTEPTNVTQPQWANALWNRLDIMVDEMADCCIKVYYPLLIVMQVLIVSVRSTPSRRSYDFVKIMSHKWYFWKKLCR